MKTLVLWLSVGLLLGLALSPAWGQPHHQEAVGVQGHEPPGQPPAVAPDIPVDDLDRGTPRRAVEGFLQAARRMTTSGPPNISICDVFPPARPRSWGRSWPVTSRSSWTRSFV